MDSGKRAASRVADERAEAIARETADPQSELDAMALMLALVPSLTGGA